MVQKAMHQRRVRHGSQETPTWYVCLFVCNPISMVYFFARHILNDHRAAKGWLFTPKRFVVSIFLTHYVFQPTNPTFTTSFSWPFSTSVRPLHLSSPRPPQEYRPWPWGHHHLQPQRHSANLGSANSAQPRV